MSYKFAWEIMRQTFIDLQKIYYHGSIPNMADSMKYDVIVHTMDNIEKGLRLAKDKTKWYNGKIGVDVPITIVTALEFGFACLGLITLVLVFMGRIAYVGR